MKIRRGRIGDGLRGLRIGRARGYTYEQIDPDVVIVVITGFATIATAVDAMKAGAYDFIAKPFAASNGAVESPHSSLAICPVPSPTAPCRAAQAGTPRR